MVFLLRQQLQFLRRVSSSSSSSSPSSFCSWPWTKDLCLARLLSQRKLSLSPAPPLTESLPEDEDDDGIPTPPPPPLPPSIPVPKRRSRRAPSKGSPLDTPFDLSLAQSVLNQMRDIRMDCPVMDSLVEQKDPAFLTLWSNLRFLLGKGMMSPKRAAELLGRSHSRFLVDVPTSRLEGFFNFLYSLGISEADAHKVVLFDPCLSLQSLELLEEKVKAFGEFGIERGGLKNAMLSAPRIFSMSIATIRARLEFFRDYGMDNLAMGKLLNNNSILLTRTLDGLRDVLSSFEKTGVSRKRICSYVKRYNSYFRLSKETIAQKELFLESLGFEERTAVMFTAKMVLIGLRSELVRQRFNHLVALGFSEAQVQHMIRRFPQILLRREEGIARSFDYLVHSYGCPLEDVVKYPFFFSISFEWRLKPRLRYVAELKRRGLVENVSVGYVLNLSDALFYRRYVKKFESHLDADESLQGLLLSTWKEEGGPDKATPPTESLTAAPPLVANSA